MRYDFNDPKIRRTVDQHRPHEIFLFDGTSNGILCDTCGREWPCAPIQALRQWQVDNGAPIE